MAAAAEKRRREGGGRAPRAKRARRGQEKEPRVSAEAFREDREVSCAQLQELLLYAALGGGRSAARPSWCHVHHQRHLTGVVVVILHEVSRLHFYQYYLQFKHLRKTFRNQFSLPPISRGFLERLCGAGSHNHQQVGKQEIQKDPIVQKYGVDKHGLSRYVLTLTEMRYHNFPLEGSSDCHHFVHSGCSDPVTDSSPLFGLDCEMCLTDGGSKLTRISLVDASGRCIMNELVKPEFPIRDYLTRYSGITAQLLHPVTTKLAAIQDQLKKLLPPDAVLVGHSLNFDLQALEMVHPNIIDTSLLFARKGGRRFKLKFLAEAVLGKEIQREDQEGHDPTEDARCALQLAQYFICQGPTKVAELNLESRLLGGKKEGDTWNSSLPELKNGVQNCAGKPVRRPSSLLDSLHSAGQKTLLLGRNDTPSFDNPQTNAGSSNRQVLQRALEEIPRSSFSVLQFALDPQHVASALVAKIGAKMRAKLASMLTVYAGPFGKGVCLKSLKRTFREYGHIRSMRVIAETAQPHVGIQYEVLEAAQLAVESLNGVEVAGSLIKVQRPVTELTLDCETLVGELESDADNAGVIYLAGLGKSLSEADLRKKLGCPADLRSVFLPTDPSSGRRRNYCFLKFHTAEGASNALSILAEQAPKGRRLRSRRAITPSRLYSWASSQAGDSGAVPAVPHSPLGTGLQEEEPEQELKKAMKALDRKLRKLYRCLPHRTLCVVLLPGTNRLSVPLPGLGLVGIKEESVTPSPLDLRPAHQHSFVNSPTRLCSC
ncbi:RNA exonuclease 5 isoform X2 [Tiliqua scincoides]|uniref:RNA exonuclease 5 isoform X2 n=1 Tax=Tiliqua scincoides TaxID=71010 RepID=UPI003461BBF4